MDWKTIAMIMVAFSALVAAAGQVFFKLASKDLSFSIDLLTNWKLILGVCLYGIGAVSMIIALKYGELSILYPIVATSYIWVSLFSIFFLGEKLVYANWIGLGLIILGVTLTSMR